MTRRGLFRALFAAPVAAVAATLAPKATPVAEAGRRLGQMTATLSKDQVCALFNVPVSTIDLKEALDLKEAIRCKVANTIEQRIMDDFLYGDPSHEIPTGILQGISPLRATIGVSYQDMEWENNRPLDKQKVQDHIARLARPTEKGLQSLYEAGIECEEVES